MHMHSEEHTQTHTSIHYTEIHIYTNICLIFMHMNAHSHIPHEHVQIKIFKIMLIPTVFPLL